jgi:undecaprenyl-diphosphatase
VSRADQEIDPVIAARSQAGWRRWAYELGRDDPERVASFGAVVGLGFVLGIAAMYAFIRLADDVLAQETTALDSAASEFVLRFKSPVMDVVMRTISLFGSELVWVLGLVLLAVFVWQRRWGVAVLLVLVTVGAQVLNDILKATFRRTRPIEVVGGIISAQQYSFPSGHAMMSAAFYFFLGYLVWHLVRGARRWLMVIGLVVLVVLIGISRIYLQVHFLSDVLAGYIAGLLWVDAVIIGSRILRTGRRRTLRA